MQTNDSALTVSALTQLIRNSLESQFPSVLVEGEISNAKLASSGHFYFSLKDRDAVIQAVMFRSRLVTTDFEPEDGMKVLARGAVSVYAARGQYQLIVQSLRKSGLGDILAMLEERKRRLSLEGLFDEGRKRPLPRFPRRVGVVTSSSGAAVRDILNVIRRRNSGVDIILLPTPVQGAEAAASISGRIRQANSLRLADVLIVGRGGGSIEDLLAFSEEEVVRAVASSRIPVISAVGHETDWSLSDYAADLRAPTPSAAAELVTESADVAAREADQYEGVLTSSMKARIDYIEAFLRGFTPRDAEMRFMRLFMPFARAVDEAGETLVSTFTARLAETSHAISLREAELEAANPQAALRRGFSIVRREKGGAILRSSSGLEKSEKVSIEFSSGSVLAEISEVHP